MSVRSRVPIAVFSAFGLAATVHDSLAIPPQDAAQVVAWIRQHAVRLTTTKPGSGFHDMAPLQRIIGSARVVALGEATHGSREFFRVKHRILEFLVAKMGFTLFGIEANWSECLPINNYS